MKQKFTFEVDNIKGIVTLTEAEEMDLGSFANLHQESYSLEEMKNVAQAGQAVFIEYMRRRNLFPPNDLAIKLFLAAEKMFQEETPEKTVVEYEDIEALPLMDDTRMDFAGMDGDDEEEDDEDVEIGELLKDDPDDLSEDDIKEIDSDDDTPRFMPDDDSEHEN
ncbi:conserved hypothetical protein [Desulfamplus magnetovallimortis]|uniref:Uncharacterized protein n=1 Tax=Desulfamplus magnetovallimortis TaxID=1246637 RepID=A0A1W1HA96_9BACT|nr:hypothetical protein [Desulfamplus magnetovallimortis]SLM29325.1 conserved hypothetical protein [Desulfamplus magnetovallimortis]